MKRTGESVLNITGTEAYLNYLHANWSKSEVAASLDQMNLAGTMWVLPGIIGVALGIITMILLKSKGSQKLTGWILIIVSVVVCMISVFGCIPAMFFIIAGIMALVRNPNVRKKQAIGKG
ncbi:hypothetical protein [Paenibacillus elgii]|uniref:hypothetical protein n=1 Tax=Paenibacillus elgii TaxID=189691 RepID=UPI000248DBB7|nr:hypothetical protein [Paenibacillus elgii]